MGESAPISRRRVGWHRRRCSRPTCGGDSIYDKSLTGEPILPSPKSGQILIRGSRRKIGSPVRDLSGILGEGLRRLAALLAHPYFTFLRLRKNHPQTSKEKYPNHDKNKHSTHTLGCRGFPRGCHSDLPLRDIQLRLSQWGYWVPLFTIWDSVAGPGRTPMPGNNSGRS